MSDTTPMDPDEYSRSLAAEGRSTGSDTEWFDELYRASEQGRAVVPWDRGHAHPLLVEWVASLPAPAPGASALVVGAGPGYDAELLSSLGFTTTAFDVSPTATAAARRRFPGSAVDYRTADLLDLPPDWTHAFALVVEIFTVQALPRSLRGRATRAVTRTVAPGGTLLVVAFVSGADDGDGPPWPLTEAEIRDFGTDGLQPVVVEELPEQRWRAEFRRVVVV